MTDTQPNTSHPTTPPFSDGSGSAREPWEIVVADDEHMFIATAGDIVCHADPNHAPDDAWDRANFAKLVAAPAMFDGIEEARSQAEMLLLAILEGDPTSELTIRVNDILEVLRKAQEPAALSRAGASS